MTPAYPEAEAMLETLRSKLLEVLGEKLVGLYLFGSLVYGDFEPEISDIDLLAVIASELDDAEFARLDKMQNDLVAAHPEWYDRIEIAYLTTKAMQTFRTEPFEIAIISPGEPFHRLEGSTHWLMNWYLVRKQGRTLYGPSPKEVIAPIAKEEFIECVRGHTMNWDEWVLDMRTRKAQAYSILTLCRALYAMKHAAQVSKKEAALWAMQEVPEWASLIQNALVWRTTRDESGVDHAATFPETQRFVHAIVQKIAEQS